MSDYFKIEDALVDVQQGKPVIVVDDAKREGEGDFIFAASEVTPQTLDFVVSVSRGAYLCLMLKKRRLEELDIPPALPPDLNTAFHKTAFMCSIDAKKGVTTGSSFYDRTVTIKTVIDENSQPDDLVRPGHVIPIMAQEGGVLGRSGHTEAAVDLVKLAGLYPAAVDIEIVGRDGHMAKEDELFYLAKVYHTKIVKIEDLVDYMKKVEGL